MGIKLREKIGRDGLKIIVPDKTKMCSLRCDSLLVRGPELWNSLPMELRELNLTKETYKKKLDEFLIQIKDEPRIEGHWLDSNKLDSRISQWVREQKR